MNEKDLQEIRTLIFQQNYEKAKKLLHNPVTSDEPDPQSIELNARIHGQTGEISKALAMFEDLETAWPERPEIFRLHVGFLQECGLIEEAREKSLQMLEAFPDWPEASICCADCHELAGKATIAMEICERAITKFPDNSGLQELKARLAPICKRLQRARSDLEIAQEELQIIQAHISTDTIFINRFLNLFTGREGVHARQTAFKKNRFGYVPVYEELQANHIKSHLAGDTTLGIYLVRKDNSCSLMAIDIDVAKPFLDQFKSEQKQRQNIRRLLLQTATHLIDAGAEIGLRFLVEFSGFKGLHLWAISDFAVPARYWRQLGNWLKEKISRLPPEIQIEIFPKQDQVEIDGLGNLVKLPLGIHKASGQRSLFVDEQGFKPWPFQAEALQSYQPVSKSEFEEILGRVTLTGRVIATTIRSEKQERIPAEPSNNDTPEPAFDLSIRIPLPERFPPEIEQILAWCPPLCEVFTTAVKAGAISPRSRHVFIYIFSALGEAGKIFLHQVLNQLEGYDPDGLNAEIRAVPPTTMSCGKVRKNLAEIVSRVACNCQFRLPEGCYASPVVHAGIFPGSKKILINPVNQPVAISTRELIAGPSAAIDKLMREYRSLREEIARANQRLQILKRRINQIFDDNGCNEITTSIGSYRRISDANDTGEENT